VWIVGCAALTALFAGRVLQVDARQRFMQERPHSGTSIRPIILAGLGVILVTAAPVLQGLEAVPLPQEAQDLGKRRATVRGLASRPEPGRIVVPFESQTIFKMHEIPVLGSSDAPYVIVSYCDYSDFHSRLNYQFVRDLRLRYRDSVLVVPLAYPLNPHCNEKIDAPPSQEHESACALARLAWAVWRAEPERFEAMHDYLMMPEDLKQTVALKEARAYAEMLVGAEALERALADPWVEAQLARNMASKSRPIPERDSQGGLLDHAPRTMWGAADETKMGHDYTGVLSRMDASRLYQEFEQSTGARPSRMNIDHGILDRLRR
jgi:hypothetical protein